MSKNPTPWRQGTTKDELDSLVIDSYTLLIVDANGQAVALAQSPVIRDRILASVNGLSMPEWEKIFEARMERLESRFAAHLIGESPIASALKPDPSSPQ